MQKKFLIFTVTAGEGHNSIAKTIKAGLEKDPNNKVLIIDIFKSHGNKGKTWFINDGYLKSCKYFMPVFNVIFKQMQKASPNRRYKNWFQKLVHRELPMIKADIEREKPDVIIGTHMFAGIAVSLLRKEGAMKVPTVQLLTDYCVTPYWESAIGVDYLITPASDMDKILLYKGYTKKQLKPLGLPVREMFNDEISREKARDELGLEKDKITLLLFMGGGGMGGMEKLVKKVLKFPTPLQVLIINGKDEKAKNNIDAILEKSESPHSFRNYGFVSNVNILMSASDMVIGKCGCTTTNEVLNRHRMFIIITRLPQQERDNMKYVTSNGAGIQMTKKKTLNKILKNLVENPEKIAEYEQNTYKIAKPNALKDICNFCENLADKKNKKTKRKKNTN